VPKLSSPAPAKAGVESSLPVPWSDQDAWIGVALFFILFIGLGLTRRLLDKNWVLSIWFLAYQPLQFIPIWSILRLRKAGWADLGFKTARSNMLPIGCGLVILAFGVNFINNLVMVMLKIPIQAEKFFGIVSSLDNPTVFMVTGIFIAPLFEETIFRGFFFRGLCQKLGWQKAALISSAVFGFCHLQIAAFIPTFVLGLIFCYLYERSESIWPGVILHMLINSFGVGLLVLLAQNGGRINF